MSETSISSSPSKSDCTIYTTRLKRRSRRSKIDLSVQNNNEDAQPDYLHDFLKDFYIDSENETTKADHLENKSKTLLKSTAILSNFKPFELVKSLVIADHLFQELSQNEVNPSSATQRFITCTNLSQANSNLQCSANKSEKDDKNESFIITETELINCCHQAEKILENDSNEVYSAQHELTPKKKDDMALVNSILKDFSQSPLSKEQIITSSSWQYTPEFRIRRLPVKNYSRRHIKCTRANLTQSFDEADAIHSSEYDEDISYCSSISVLEDDTLCESISNQSIAPTLNNTERLCENLLNLTEYFTQNELNQSSEEGQQSRDVLHSSKTSNAIVSNLQKISDLLDNILNIRFKYTNELRNDSYDSSDDFNGFVNNEYEICNRIVEQNVISTNIDLGSDFNAGDIQHTNNLKENEDNPFLDDWNEDELACIETEHFLQSNKNRNNVDLTSKCTNKNQTFVVPNASILNSALCNLIKPKEANIIAPEILHNLFDVTDFTEESPLPNCDKALNKDESIFENPEDYEWNDDCDLFLNFQTPISFKENVVKNTRQNKSTVAEISQVEQDAPSTSKFAALGFTTAAGKNVPITSKGQATVQKLLNEFAGELNNNKNYEEELEELKHKVYAKTHNFKGEQPLTIKQQKIEDESHQDFVATRKKTKRLEPEIQISSNNCTNTFNVACADILEMTQPTNETDKSRSSELSTKTQNSIKKLLEESVDFPSEQVSADIEANENAFNIKRDPLDLMDIKNPLVFKNHNMKTNHLGMGFQTANGKEVSISREAKQKVNALLKEFNADVDIEKELKDIKMKVQIKNKHLKPNPNHFNEKNEDFTEPLSIDQGNMERIQLNANAKKGFQTANGKEISISAKAKQAVESLLKELNTDFDIESCEKNVKDLKAQVLNKKKDFVSNSFSSETDNKVLGENLDARSDLNKKSDQLGEDSETLSLHKKPNIIINHLNANEHVGFQTASGKQVSISAKAKETVENIFKDFNTAVDFEYSEKYLKDMKMKIQMKNKELQAKSVSQTTNETPTLKLNDNFSVKQINRKRKICIDNNDIETSNKTPAVKIFKKSDLQSSKSSLIQQSPPMSATRSIIVRKNLLSLTKKRRNKGNTLTQSTKEISEVDKDLNDLNACTATPTKPCLFEKSKEPAPETPNLKEFLSNASLTSTPRINKPQSSLQTFEDSDLKPIIWQNDSSFCNKSQNKSSYATKLSESSTSNISFNSPNPTAKERIGRLKMYGKAPDVSPILIEMSHNCRPSGLRRTRSMLKNPDN